MAQGSVNLDIRKWTCPVQDSLVQVTRLDSGQVSGPYEHGNSPRQEESDMKQLAKISAVATMLALASSASADLNRVGPAHIPSPPGDGFPAWYQDLNGMVLDECIPTASATQDPANLQHTACLLVDPLPFTFPNLFPPEVFYHRVVSNPVTTSPAGQRATLVLALEASFANGTPTAGQQMVFTRIRVTAGVPFDGTYTVTHPYGTETFTNVISSGGNRDIFFTEDVGLTPLDFTGALTSRVGPFLEHSDVAPGGAAAGPLFLPFVTNPDGTTSGVPGSRLFLGDGVTPRFITGSPFGTNYFEICGPFDGPGTNSCIRENLFTVTGMLHDPATPIGSPLSVTRATFNRNDAASQVDVMARASAGPGQVAPKLTAAGNAVAPVLMAGPTNLGDWYAQGLPVPSNKIPTQITVTNSSDVPPTSINSHVTDEITIKSVAYAAGTLTVVATSSDKGDTTVNPVIPPAVLSLAGFPTATRVFSAPTTDRAEVTFTASVTPLANGTLVPPAFVRVESNMGGLVSADTSLGLANPAFPGGVPYAADEAVSFVQDASGALPAAAINVLANDVGGASAINPATLAVVAPLPSIGVASAANGQIFYKVPATTGTAAIRYTVNNGVGTSNVGTVFVTVLADPTGPIPSAVNDPAVGGAINVTAGGSVSINVLANDTANDPTGVVKLNPASVVVTTPPARGTATVNTTTGAITYTSPAGSPAGTVTFQYRVSTLASGTAIAKQSNAATVTVTVAAGETLTVQNPIKCSLPNKWQIRGTSNISTSNTITIYAGPTASGTVIGTTPVVNGAWQFQGLVTCTSPISIKSTVGTTILNQIVQVK
jgi:hypothetical protein